jgi:DNA anti-recombination protein RmuC
MDTINQPNMEHEEKVQAERTSNVDCSSTKLHTKKNKCKNGLLVIQDLDMETQNLTRPKQMLLPQKF